MNENPRSTRASIAHGSVAADAGFSLLEVLIAAFLVATVAVFLAPLFMRAVASNIEGNEASSAINFDKSFLETLAAIPMNHNQLDVRQLPPAAPDPTVRRILTMVFDTGARNADELDVELGDERWIPRTAVEETYAIQRRWDFDLDLREYSYADIVDGQISSVSFGDPADAANPLTLIALPGDPDVFDNPLTQVIQSPFRHVKESTARISSRRESGALGSTDQTDATRMRSY